MDLNKYLDYLVLWIQKQVKKAKADGVIVGLSGGIDSAVVALLAKKAFPNNYLTLWMPCNSQKLDYDCIDQIKKENNLNIKTINLKNAYDILIESLEFECIKLAKANTIARMRMTCLYAIGQSLNYLVLGTDNLAEWYLGYFTKYGDGGVDLLPISQLRKCEIYQAGKILNVPNIIIERKPSASLWPNQSDEEEMKVTYKEIDAYLNNEKISEIAKKRIENMYINSNHKRKKIPKPNGFLKKVV